MGADAGDPSFIQNNDLLCVEDRADTLGYDDRRRLSSFFLQNFSKSCIRLIIQCGKTVIENINLRLSGNRPGNGQTLFLTAGYIRTALGNRRIILFFLFFNEITGLGNLGRFMNLVFAHGILAVSDIGSDGS